MDTTTSLGVDMSPSMGGGLKIDHQGGGPLIKKVIITTLPLRGWPTRYDIVWEFIFGLVNNFYSLVGGEE